MKRFVKFSAWAVGIVSAFVLFAEPTAEIFPVQLVAGATICAIFVALNRQEQEVTHA